MSVAWSPCVHTARTAMLRVSGRSGRFASFRRAGLRFRTIADMMPLSWYNEKSTANAVGCNPPSGVQIPDPPQLAGPLPELAGTRPDS